MKHHLFVFLLAGLFSTALVSCKKDLPENPQSSNPEISALVCEAWHNDPGLLAGIPYSDTLLLPYSGGNGKSFQSGDTIRFNGLQIVLQNGTLENGNGNLKLAVWGTPVSIGANDFTFSFAGKACQLKLQTGNPDTLQYDAPFNGVPDRNDVAIYQVNMRIFSNAGNFQGVTERLDSIRKMGTNVIYLMPIYQIGSLKAFNSPYCVRSYNSINPEFGNLDDLRLLVKAAHQRNMAVMLDWVGNHTSWDHEWISTHRDWYLRDASGNPVSPPNTNWTDVAQLNLSKQEMRLEMIKKMKYWIYKTNIDGFRCDYADGAPFDYWRQVIDSLRQIPNRKLILMAEGGRNNHFVAGFDFTFGFGFFNKMKTIYKSNTSATELNALNFSEFSAATNGQQVVRYTSNHDVNGADGTPLELFNGMQGSLTAFTITALMKGVPMVYGGQETGTSSRFYFPFTGSNINWGLNPGIASKYRHVLSIRNSISAIRYAEPQIFSTAGVVAFSKEWQGEKVLVLINIRNANQSISIPTAWANQTWTDATTGNPINLGSSYDLSPYESLILKN
jgi:glycosidase